MREEVSPPAVSVVVSLFNEEENVPICRRSWPLRSPEFSMKSSSMTGQPDRTLARLTSGPESHALRFRKRRSSAAMYAGADAARARPSS